RWRPGRPGRARGSSQGRRARRTSEARSAARGIARSLARTRADRPALAPGRAASWNAPVGGGTHRREVWQNQERNRGFELETPGRSVERGKSPPAQEDPVRLPEPSGASEPDEIPPIDEAPTASSRPAHLRLRRAGAVALADAVGLIGGWLALLAFGHRTVSLGPF